jgi:hypothetical protein
MVKVFILAGQSNVAGVDYYDATGQSGAFSRVKIFRNPPHGDPKLDGTWQALNYTAENNNYMDSGALGSWDLELATLLEAEYPDEDIYFVKVAWGGRGLDPEASNPWWMPNGQLRNALIQNHLPAALNSLVGMGLIPEPIFIWDQGENDTGSSAVAGRYQANLTALIAEVRTAIRMPTLPFIINGLAPKPDKPNFVIIRNGQQAVVTADANCYLNNVDSHPKIAVGDSHFTTAGYKMTAAGLVDIITTITPPSYSPVTPDDINAANGNGFLHFTGSDIADGVVSQWKNRFNLDVSQSASAQRPVAADGVVAMEIDDFFQASLTSASTYNYHAFFKLKPGPIGSGCLMELVNAAGHRILIHLLFNNSGTVRLAYSTDVEGWKGVITDTALTAKIVAGGVFEYRLKDGTGTITLNGEVLFHAASGAYTPRQAPDSISIGARLAGNLGYAGDMEDVVVFRSGAGAAPLTEYEAAAIRSYLFYKN